MAIEQFVNDEDGLVHRGKLNEMVSQLNSSDPDAGKIPHQTDATLSGVQHVVDLSTTGKYTGTITDTVNIQDFAYTFGADVADYSQIKDIIIDNVGNSVACTLTFTGSFVWGNNVAPTGIAAGTRAILTLETNKTEVIASYLIL